MNATGSKCSGRPKGRSPGSFPVESRRLRLADWPLADREAWLRARHKGEFLDEPGRAAHWAAATCRTRNGIWGGFLAFLQRKALLDPSVGPAARLTDATLRAFAEDMSGRLSLFSKRQQLIELRWTVAALAPECDWSWLARHPALPTASAAHATKRFPQVFDPMRLCKAAIVGMSQIDIASDVVEECVLYRDCLMTLFLALLPIRRRNLAMIQVGQHLILGTDYMSLRFLPTETKTGLPLEVTIPDSLAEYLCIYCDRPRKTLLGEKKHDYLWVNRHGDPLSYSGLNNLFIRIGQALIGRPLYPHLFRHSMATELLRRSPQDIDIASYSLGHKTKREVVRSYDQSGAEPSQRAWQRVLKAQKVKHAR